MPDTRPGLDALREALDKIEAMANDFPYYDGPTAIAAAGILRATLSPATGDSGPVITARDVYEAWAAAMDRQGRVLAPERRSWALLPQQEKDLDADIAYQLNRVGDSRQSEGLREADEKRAIELSARLGDALDALTTDPFTSPHVWRNKARSGAVGVRSALAVTPEPTLDAERLAVVVEMENEGVVTWGDAGHRDRFLALGSADDPTLLDDVRKFVRWSANVRNDTAEAIAVARDLNDRLAARLHERTDASG